MDHGSTPINTDPERTGIAGRTSVFIGVHLWFFPETVRTTERTGIAGHPSVPSVSSVDRPGNRTDLGSTPINTDPEWTGTAGRTSAFIGVHLWFFLKPYEPRNGPASPVSHLCHPCHPWIVPETAVPQAGPTAPPI
jgi:hypothetical protein